MHLAEQVATRYFQAVAAGDRSTLESLFADDLIYRFPGRSSFAANYQGRDSVLGYLDRLRELTDGSLEVEILDVMTSDTRATGFVRATASQGDVEFSWQLVAVIVSRDG